MQGVPPAIFSATRCASSRRTQQLWRSQCSSQSPPVGQPPNNSFKPPTARCFVQLFGNSEQFVHLPAARCRFGLTQVLDRNGRSRISHAPHMQATAHPNAWIKAAPGAVQKIANSPNAQPTASGSERKKKTVAHISNGRFQRFMASSLCGLTIRSTGCRFWLLAHLASSAAPVNSCAMCLLALRVRASSVSVPLLSFLCRKQHPSRQNSCC